MLDTSTSFGPASALTRAPMCTAIPPMSSPPRTRRCATRREEAVARCVHLATPKARELRSDDSVVRVEQRMPVAVADLGGPSRRVHDVGEQHGGENPIVGHFGSVPGEELGDLLRVTLL